MPKLHTAFVLGAGLGTRLMPLTERLPKPLIPVCQKPLITFAFDRLIDAGAQNFVVNTHHVAEAYAREFPDGAYRGRPLFFSHEEILLETGGGLKQAEAALGETPFIVYNGDVLSSLPLEGLAARASPENEVTLVLRSSGGPLHVALDEASTRVLDIGGRAAGLAGGYLFTGIYVVSPRFLARIAPGAKVSVIPLFLEMIRRGERLGAVVIDEGEWWDLGSREQYLAAHKRLKDDFAEAGEPRAVWRGSSGVGKRDGAHREERYALWRDGCRGRSGDRRRCFPARFHFVGWSENCFRYKARKLYRDSWPGGARRAFRTGFLTHGTRSNSHRPDADPIPPLRKRGDRDQPH